MRIFRKISGVIAVCICAVTFCGNVAAAQSANFSGPYVDIDVGLAPNSATWNFHSFDFGARDFGFSPVNASGFGGYVSPSVGYSQQVGQTGLGSIVVGAAADFDVSTIPGVRTGCFHDIFDCLTNTSDLFTARGTLGLVPPGADFMLYATGGLAGANVFDQKFGPPFIAPMRFAGVAALEEGVTKFQLGWSAGAGIEIQPWAPGTLGPGALSFQAQFIYVGLPSTNVTGGVSVAEGISIFTLGALYRFSWTPRLSTGL